MNQRIEHITIVGGGTAGWLTAIILDRFLRRERSKNSFRITLIESPDHPTIGVGESTIATLPKMFRLLGLSESEVFRECGTTFKLSVKFSGWNQKKDGSSIDFFNPFNSPENLDGLLPAYHHLKFEDPENKTSLAENILPVFKAIKMNKGPRLRNAADYNRPIGYGYHIDAAALATFLKKKCIERGVHFVSDNFVDVEQDDKGCITKLNLQKSEDLKTDFVMDCTGFSSLIMDKVLKEPFVDFSQYLLNDRAIAAQIPLTSFGDIRPFTQSTALSAGWVWRVPLRQRTGSGYVFSSKFISDDEAKSEFLQHLKLNENLKNEDEVGDLRVITFRTGHRKRSWVKNCIAIGLSSGFVEPLEATSIYTIEYFAKLFVRNLPLKGENSALAEHFNKRANALYDEIRDYIQTHYLFSNRAEPYWRSARENVKISDTLASNLELWKHRLPERDDTQNNILFKYWSYIFILQPKGYFDDRDFANDSLLDEKSWDRFKAKNRIVADQFCNSVVNHSEVVNSLANSIILKNFR